MVQVGDECFEITIVDSQQGGANRENSLQVLRFVDFNQRLHPQFDDAGVEIGQILALSAVFIILSVWRSSASFLRHAFVTNTALMTGGFMLAGFQMSAFFLQTPY